MPVCQGKTATGAACKRAAITGTKFCASHTKKIVIKTVVKTTAKPGVKKTITKTKQPVKATGKSTTKKTPAKKSAANKPIKNSTMHYFMLVGAGQEDLVSAIIDKMWEWEELNLVAVSGVDRYVDMMDDKDANQILKILGNDYPDGIFIGIETANKEVDDIKNFKEDLDTMYRYSGRVNVASKLSIETGMDIYELKTTKPAPKKTPAKKTAAKKPAVKVTKNSKYFHYFMIKDNEYLTGSFYKKLIAIIGKDPAMTLTFVFNHTMSEADYENVGDLRHARSVVSTLGEDDYGTLICIETTVENKRCSGIMEFRSALEERFVIEEQMDDFLKHLGIYRVSPDYLNQLNFGEVEPKITKKEQEQDEDYGDTHYVKQIINKLEESSDVKETIKYINMHYDVKTVRLAAEHIGNIDLKLKKKDLIVAMVTKYEAVEKEEPKTTKKSTNERTNMEKMLASMHDVRTVYTPDYIMIGNFALFDDANVNQGELHLTPADITGMIKATDVVRGKRGDTHTMELVLVDVIRYDEDLYRPGMVTSATEKKLKAMVKESEHTTKRSGLLEKAIKKIKESPQLRVDDFGSQIIAFENKGRGFDNVLKIMNYLAAKNPDSGNHGAPSSMHTFDVQLYGEEDDDGPIIPGAMINHNVVFLGYNRN